MYTITKQFEFSAGHQLRHLPADHKCAREHGHNYVVEVELQAERLDANGFVVDYGDLSLFKQLLDGRFDHRHFEKDDLLAGRYSTAENLARHFYDWCKMHWPQTAAVRVSETPKTWAEYRPTRRPPA